MNPDHRSALETTIRSLHGGEPTFRSASYVREEFHGQAVWEGPVYTFDLRDHPTAKRAYGLACPVDGSRRVEFVAILEAGPVHDAQTAVRVYVASKAKAQKPPSE